MFYLMQFLFIVKNYLINIYNNSRTSTNMGVSISISIKMKIRQNFIYVKYKNGVVDEYFLFEYEMVKFASLHT